jgi:hypothetical protein
MAFGTNDPVALVPAISAPVTVPVEPPEAATAAPGGPLAIDSPEKNWQGRGVIGDTHTLGPFMPAGLTAIAHVVDLHTNNHLAWGERGTEIPIAPIKVLRLLISSHLLSLPVRRDGDPLTDDHLALATTRAGCLRQLSYRLAHLHEALAGCNHDFGADRDGHTGGRNRGTQPPRTAAGRFRLGRVVRLQRPCGIVAGEFTRGEASRRVLVVHGDRPKKAGATTQSRSSRPGQEPQENSTWPPPLSGRGRYCFS